jgi:hypothetical protein
VANKNVLSTLGWLLKESEINKKRKKKGTKSHYEHFQELVSNIKKTLL